MNAIEKLLLSNKEWSKEMHLMDPDFFERLKEGQTPEVLWIGCSDSRVPAEIIVNGQPGEMFVHRNIANQFITTDFNSLSVLQFAIVSLKVKHVVVCGHYNCGGIRAALNRQNHEIQMVNKWLKHIKDVYRLHEIEMESILDPEAKTRRLVELNVIEQVYNLAHTSIVQAAWASDLRPSIHGLVYGIEDGLLKELIHLPPQSQINPLYRYG